ncbi:DUF4144 family protein [Psychrosphaera sp. I2R16]|uniref:DUF4144 family protein n=1 Tax=unclassified Psychrosphaera TaxID=2641570 RepID=UPI0034CF827A
MFVRLHFSLYFLTILLDSYVSAVSVMIMWPCMLKLYGDDELIFLNSLRDVNFECGELLFSDDDYVIDSVGHCYLIKPIEGQIGLIKNNKVLSTDDVLHLIRAHEFNKSSVCLTKIHFFTISDAINSLSI